MRTRVVALLGALTLGCSTSLRMIEEAPAGPGTFRVGVIHCSAKTEDRETPEGAAATLRENFQEMATLTRMAVRAGAQIVVTPEYVNTGVGLSHHERDLLATDLPAAPTDRPVWELPGAGEGISPIVVDYARLSAELGIWLVTNVVERSPPDDDGYVTFFNTMIAFDVHGRLVASYRKVNLYFWEYRNVARGDETVSFDTPWGRFGMLLCFDVMWPKTWSELCSEHGCDFFVVQSYWEHVPYTGQMAMNTLADLSGLPVLWANQRRLGLGGGAGVVRPWKRDTMLGIWGPTGVVVANLPLPERLRDVPIDPDSFEPRMLAYR